MPAQPGPAPPAPGGPGLRRDGAAEPGSEVGEQYREARGPREPSARAAGLGRQTLASSGGARGARPERAAGGGGARWPGQRAGLLSPDPRRPRPGPARSCRELCVPGRGDARKGEGGEPGGDRPRPRARPAPAALHEKAGRPLAGSGAPRGAARSRPPPGPDSPLAPRPVLPAAPAPAPRRPPAWLPLRLPPACAPFPGGPLGLVPAPCVSRGRRPISRRTPRAPRSREAGRRAGGGAGARGGGLGASSPLSRGVPAGAPSKRGGMCVLQPRP